MASTNFDSDQHPGVSNRSVYDPAYSAMNPHFQSHGAGSYHTGFPSYIASSPNPYASLYGGNYGMNPYNALTNEHLWQGYLGRSAEYLGRLNNFLSMTGMLVDHISNHAKLLYAKSQELQSWYYDFANFATRHTEILERLGFQVESGWLQNVSNEELRRRMLIRRMRSLIVAGIVIILLFRLRQRRRRSRLDRLEEAFRYNRF
jgi:hypothetical protein